MSKMSVTLLIQTELDWDPADEDVYMEKLDELVQSLEESGYSVSVESEEPVDDDTDEVLI